jgi:hypothetical protein
MYRQVIEFSVSRNRRPIIQPGLKTIHEKDPADAIVEDYMPIRIKHPVKNRASTQQADISWL